MSQLLPLYICVEANKRVYKTPVGEAPARVMYATTAIRLAYSQEMIYSSFSDSFIIEAVCFCCERHGVGSKRAVLRQDFSLRSLRKHFGSISVTFLWNGTNGIAGIRTSGIDRTYPGIRRLGEEGTANIRSFSIFLVVYPCLAPPRPRKSVKSGVNSVFSESASSFLIGLAVA